METLTINRKTTTTQSVTIPLPYYAATSDRCWAVLSERTVLCVVTYEGCAGIYNADIGGIPENVEQISSEAFAQAFQKARLALDKQFAETCPSLQVAA